MRTQVSFVIQLIDDFTDKTVSDASIRVRAANQYIPIRKSEGYYVFLDCPRGIQVSIESLLYHPEKIDIAGEGTPGEVIKVRLKPGRQYPLPEQTVCVAGKAPKHARIGVVFEREASCWKLLYDYAGDKDPLKLRLFNPTGIDLEGRWFLIMNKDGNRREFFRVMQYQLHENTCILEAPLSVNYKKAGTRIYSFYDTRADEKGDYFLPMRERIVERTPCLFYLGEESSEGYVEPGNRNRKDFMS